MYEVNSDFQYITHFCGDEDIAQAVYNDLVSREDCIEPQRVRIDEQDYPASWDPGGPLWISDTKYRFEFENFSLDVYYQHILKLKNWVNRSADDARNWNGLRYYKIHSGYLSCLCLSINDFARLQERLKDQILTFKSETAAEDRLTKIEEAGILQVTRDTSDNIVRLKPKKKLYQ